MNNKLENNLFEIYYVK